MTEAASPERPAALIVTGAAAEFAAELSLGAGADIPVRCCRSAAEAAEAYAGERILFGNPAMIAAAFAAMPGVDWVQSTWAGVTPLIEHPRRDYVLTGIKDVFGPQMSEYVLGFLLAHELKILQRLEDQRHRRWSDEHSGTLEGRRLCILGTGSIARHIARSAASFGVTVTGVSRSGSPAPGFAAVAPLAKLHAVLQNSDYLVATLPQTPETDDLLDAAALSALPAHAYFINVGRGNCVADEALIEALRDGRLAGAALDVFNEEPIPEDSPLWDTPNLSITPHVAAVSHAHLIVPIFVDNYARYLRGEPLRYAVDFAAGY